MVWIALNETQVELSLLETEKMDKMDILLSSLWDGGSTWRCKNVKLGSKFSLQQWLIRLNMHVQIEYWFTAGNHDGYAWPWMYWCILFCFQVLSFILSLTKICNVVKFWATGLLNAQSYGRSQLYPLQSSLCNNERCIPGMWTCLRMQVSYETSWSHF